LIYDTEKIPIVNEEEMMTLCRMWNTFEPRDTRAAAFGFGNLSLNEANLEVMNSFSVLQYVVEGLLHKDPHIARDTTRALYHFCLYERYHSKIVEEIKAVPRIVNLLKVALEEDVCKDALGIIYNLSKSGKYRSVIIQELQKVNIDDVYDDNKKAYQAILNALNSEALTSEKVAAQFVRERPSPKEASRESSKEISLLDLDDIPESQQINIVESRPKTRAELLKSEDRPKVKRMNSDDFFNALDATSKTKSPTAPPTTSTQTSTVTFATPPDAGSYRKDINSPGSSRSTRTSRSKSLSPPDGVASPIPIQPQPAISNISHAGSPPSPLKSLGLNAQKIPAPTRYDDSPTNLPPDSVRANRSRSVTDKLGDAFSKVLKVKKTYNTIEESAQFIDTDN
jgi:hypothetical protein